MTTPDDNFQVNDDSVVAKLSVEIPSGSAENLHAINQQTEQLRVNLEAVSRSNQSWLEYLKQVPTLTQQASEAQRDLLVQLERTSYIQQNLGGLASQTSGGTPMMPQPYSTAAPGGYTNPFMGMTAGLGVGGPQNAAQANAYMQQLSTQNPRLMANMMAQNGMDPSTAMGMFGAGVTPSGIWTPPGASVGGGTGPGTGSGGNVGGGAPQPGAGGLPGQVTALGQQAWNQGAGARTMANVVGGGGGGGGTPPGGGGGGGGGAPPPSGAPGSGSGRIGNTVAQGMGINALIQGAGEQIQRYRNLGGQAGGGAIEGLGLETQARIQALDPSLTLGQTRSIQQAALGSGFQGKEFETIVKLMTDNVKNLNMSASDTNQLFNSMVVTGGQSVGEFKKSMEDLLDYSRTGLVRRDEKIQQTKQVSGDLASMGFSGEAQRLMTRTATEGFATDPILAHAAPGILSQGMGNDLAVTMAGRSMGVTGLPDAVRLKMSRNPEAANKAMEEPLRQWAQRAHDSSPDDEDTAVAKFRYLAENSGYPMDLPKAQEWYRRLIGGNSAAAAGEQRAANISAGDPGMGSRVANTGGGIINRAKQLFGMGGGEQMGDQETVGGRAGPAAESSSAPAPRPRPQLPTEATGPIQVQTSGQVNGHLVVTIDQQTGKASAPPTVQLTGNQQSVNAGGGGTLNSLQPGQQPPGNGMR